MTPRISIVIPTHDRCESLLRTLRALEHQDISSTDFEVIVVADGCTDGTIVRVGQLAPSYAMRVLEQPALGAATARNRGAREAIAPLILFIDDDVEPGPATVSAHLHMHAQRPGDVVLGAYSPPLDSTNADFVIAFEELWWRDHFTELGRSWHRYTFRDFCTGNLSLAKHLFERNGGFDESFEHCFIEDYELGVRLLKDGMKFSFVPAAAAVHHMRPTIKRTFERTFLEGRHQVRLVCRHPEICTALPLASAMADGPWIKIGKWFRLRPWMMKALPHALELPVRFTAALRLRRPWHHLIGIVRSCYYWHGVLSELGSEVALRRFLQDLPCGTRAYRTTEIDITTDLPRLEDLLRTQQPQAVGLRFGTTPLGHIPATPGAEPLRPVHVRHALVHWFGYNLLTALLRDDEKRNDNSGLATELARSVVAEPRRVPARVKVTQ